MSADHTMDPVTILKTCITTLALILFIAGCGKPPPPQVQPVEDEPVTRYGIFHGEWRWRLEPFYNITHSLGEPPVVSICSNKAFHTVITNVTAKGRTMTFDQYDSEPQAGPTFELHAPTPIQAPSTTHWAVVMRIAINDPDSLLIEKTCSGLTHKQLLTRSWPGTIPIIPAGKLNSATNVRPPHAVK